MPKSLVFDLLIKLNDFVTLRLFLRLIKYINQNQQSMSLLRVLLAIIFPPLSVIGKGCGSFVIVFLLTLCGWVPGIIAALVILNNPN